MEGKRPRESVFDAMEERQLEGILKEIFRQAHPDLKFATFKIDSARTAKNPIGMRFIIRYSLASEDKAVGIYTVSGNFFKEKKYEVEVTSVEEEDLQR